MSVYDNNRDTTDQQQWRGDRNARAGYRPGWIWIPLAVLLLLTLLVIGTGFIYGGYNDRMRGYDNGTGIEQSGGDSTQPNLPTPNPGAGTESGVQPDPNRARVIPEEAPALSNDGQ